LQPIYDPKTFDVHKILKASSFAALTYIGFDGVTTLAEDVENPKRNILLAVVLTCIFAGVCSAFEAYLGARVWPEWQTFTNLETAFMDICNRVGGKFMFNAMGTILIIAAFGSGLTGTLGAARLLFGMGRDNVLPKKFFGQLKPGTSTPTNNILLIGGVSFIGAILLYHIGNAYEHAAELLNFGAFLAFMGVNLACFWQFSVKVRSGYKRRILADAVLPLIGFLFCSYFWWNLNSLAKTVGGVWFAVGILYVGYKTNWFRSAPVMIDFSDN
jgi:putrescine importer